jgi:DNA repair exonuclease SbcCD ATPase subunit
MFEDTTASYSEELIEAANYVLDEQHNKLVRRLNGKYDGDDTLQASRLLQDAIETATSEVKPLSEETITITNKQKDTGARTEQTYTLDQRVTQFKVTIRAEEAKVVKLSKEYDALLRSIAVFMANKLEPGLEPASGTNREKIQEWREEIEAEIGELGEEELQELKDERKSDRQNLKKLKVVLDAF